MSRLWLVLLVLGACKTPAPVAPDLAHVAVAGSAVQPLPAWTNPAVVARLAKSCAFDPTKLPLPEQATLYGVTEVYDDDIPLSCASGIFDQGCSYDPCWDKQEDACKPACVKTCTGCDTACVATCGTCEAACSDDACRHACALTTATCKQSCLLERDHCGTGRCTKERIACRAKLKADWIGNGCPKICDAYAPCVNQCAKLEGTHMKEVGACVKRCDAKMKPLLGTPAKCELALCRNDMAESVDPMSPDE